MIRPSVKIRRVMIHGDDPGVETFDVDPPLLDGEVEIKFDREMSAAERAAFDDLARST